jgi:hypothetical protein
MRPKKPGGLPGAIENAAAARHLRRDRVSTLVCSIPACYPATRECFPKLKYGPTGYAAGCEISLKEAKNGYGYGEVV